MGELDESGRLQAYFLVQFTTDDDLRDKVLRTPDTALKRRFAVRAAHVEHFRPEEHGRLARKAATAVARKVGGSAGPRASL
jgi:hypothetical protein